MNYTSSVQAFDFIASCYIYGCIAYLGLLFGLHLYSSLLIAIDAQSQGTYDFYEQVKVLLNPATEPVMAMELEPTNFETMTTRELRTHIKENHLQQYIRVSIGKTVSNARKSQLIASLKTI